MTLRRMCRRHASIGLVAVALTASSLTAGIIAQNAAAAPSTKWFTDTVGSSSATLSSTLVYPVSPSAQTFVLQVTTAADSNQSLGSAGMDLLTDWKWATGQVSTSNAFALHWTSAIDANKHVIHLRNDGTGSQYAIAPGGFLQIPLTFTTLTGGIDVPTFVIKQSN